MTSTTATQITLTIQAGENYGDFLATLNHSSLSFEVCRLARDCFGFPEPSPRGTTFDHQTHEIQVVWWDSHAYQGRQGPSKLVRSVCTRVVYADHAIMAMTFIDRLQFTIVPAAMEQSKPARFPWGLDGEHYLELTPDTFLRPYRRSYAECIARGFAADPSMPTWAAPSAPYSSAFIVPVSAEDSCGVEPAKCLARVVSHDLSSDAALGLAARHPQAADEAMAEDTALEAVGPGEYEAATLVTTALAPTPVSEREADAVGADVLEAEIEASERLPTATFTSTTDDMPAWMDGIVWLEREEGEEVPVVEAWDESESIEEETEDCSLGDISRSAGEMAWSGETLVDLCFTPVKRSLDHAHASPRKRSRIDVVHDACDLSSTSPTLDLIIGWDNSNRMSLFV